MNNHAATYNPTGGKNKPGASGKGRDGSGGKPASESYEDVFVNAVENRCWGLSRLPPHHSRRGFTPPAGEKEEEDGNASQWGDEADVGGDRGEGAGHHERG
jgi:hypothetical protein